MVDLIDVAGIISTLLVGIITCVVTWTVAKRSQKTMRLSWSADVSKVLNIDYVMNIGKIQLVHDGVELENPYMIQVNIMNTGNTAIDSPDIMIKIKNSKKVIPVGFGKIPYGYEDKWRLSSINDEECKAHLDHINPKQEFNIMIFAECICPMILLSCPMKDVFLKEKQKDAKDSIDIKPTTILWMSITILILLQTLMILQTFS